MLTKSGVDRECLEAELEGWRGTRFAANKRRRGVAADCAGFVFGALAGAGVIAPYVLPERYPCFGGPAVLDLVMEHLLAAGLRPVVVETFAVGDVLVTSQERRGHHLAIYAGGHVGWHCIRGRGVQTFDVREPVFVRDLHSIWRAGK